MTDTKTTGAAVGQNTGTEAGFSLFLAALAVGSLAVYILTAALDASPWWQAPFEWAVWAVFAAEYSYRLREVGHGNRVAWMKAHPLELAAVAVPTFRVLRVIATIARLFVTAQRGRAERFMVATAMSAGVVVLTAAAAVLNAERGAEGANIVTYGDAVWWATATVTTVGYGDRFPVTAEGRVIAGLLMVVGIGVVGSVIGAVSSRFSRTG